MGKASSLLKSRGLHRSGSDSLPFRQVWVVGRVTRHLTVNEDLLWRLELR